MEHFQCTKLSTKHFTGMMFNLHNLKKIITCILEKSKLQA